jgi:hypothetical protein
MLKSAIAETIISMAKIQFSLDCLRAEVRNASTDQSDCTWIANSGGCDHALRYSRALAVVLWIALAHS